VEKGNIGLAITQEYGGGTPNIAVGAIITYTGADTIFDLESMGFSGGISAWLLGVDSVAGQGYISIEIAVGLGALAKGHGLITITDIIPLNSG
jgi:hypothetical protein